MGDQVYYNILISNTPTNGQFNSIPASYSENRSIPIVQDPSQYYLSVIRFTVPMTSVPIFIFQIQNGPGQTDPNLGQYSVTLEDSSGNVSQAYLNFVTSQEYKPVPPPPSQNSPYFLQSDSAYYYVYNIEHMLGMMNKALIAAEAALPPQAGRTAPYFIYTPVAKIITLVAQEGFYNIDTPGHTKIYANIPLQRFVMNMPVTFTQTSTNPQGKNYYFRVKDNGNNVAAGLITVDQELPSLSVWNDVASVVFTSGRMPVAQEGVPAQGNATQYNTNAGNGAANSRPIVTDFEIIADDDINLRTLLQYVPTGPYRLIDLTSNQPLVAIDIDISWVDRNNNLHPIYIAPFQNASIKMLFVKKSFYDSRFGKGESSRVY